jgi:hypothetical protein
MAAGERRGRHRRNGVREVTADAAQYFADHEAERRTNVQQTLGIRVLKPIEVKPSEERVVPFISDSTIRFEMSIFGAIMNYAVKKRYVPASHEELSKRLGDVTERCLARYIAGKTHLREGEVREDRQSSHH